MMTSTPPSNIKELLSLISAHIGNRSEFRGQEFTVVVEDGTGAVSITPSFNVFRDRYHRKDADRVDLMTHVVVDHLNSVDWSRGPHYALLLSDKFVPGTYDYVLSFRGRRRTWIRR